MFLAGGAVRGRGQAQNAWFTSLVHMPQFRPNLLKVLGGVASLNLSHFQITPEQCGILFVNFYGCLWL